MDPLRLLKPLVQQAGPEVRITGRELLSVVVAAERASLYPAAPGWVRRVCTLAGTEEGVSPALLEAISGELTDWDPGTRPIQATAWPGNRVGLLGLPLQLCNGTGPEQLTAELEDLEAGDPEAAERVLRNAQTAARFIAGDASRLELVQVLEYYAGLGNAGHGRSGRAWARRIFARYLWILLERLPRDRAAELLDSFAHKRSP